MQNWEAFCDFLCNLSPNEVIWRSCGTTINDEISKILKPIKFQFKSVSSSVITELAAEIFQNVWPGTNPPPPVQMGLRTYGMKFLSFYFHFIGNHSYKNLPKISLRVDPLFKRRKGLRNND